MNLRYLRYFAGVAEHMSFSAASRHLNISQPALSRQIQQLERDLGVHLFDRIGRRIALTAAGSDLLARCQSILQSVESFSVRAEELASGATGMLRVGATPQTLESVISPFLVAYRRKYPDVDVILLEDGSAGLLRHVERGTIQVAIASLTSDTQFEGRNLFPLGVLAVVPDGHPFLARNSVEVADLADEPLLLLRQEFMTRQLFDGACQIAHIRPRTMIESGSPHCLLSLVGGGLGLAILPSTVLLGHMAGNAVPLRQDGKQLGFWMSAVWNAGRYVSPPAKAFVEELVSSAQGDYPGRPFGFADLIPAVSD